MGFYQNEKVQKLLDEQLKEFDKEKRFELLKEVQLIAEKEAFGINLLYMKYNIVKHKNVHDVGTIIVPDSDAFNIYNAWIE